MPTFLFRILLVLSTAFFCHSALAMEAQDIMSFNITTRMLENGETDNDRLYLFYLNYFGYDGYENCEVQSLVIRNLSCSSDPKEALPSSRALWIQKPEFCNRSRPGCEGFSCTRKALGDGKFEFTFRIPAGLAGSPTGSAPFSVGHSSHRLIMQFKPYRILEYSGSLSNYTGLDRTIKYASYVPLISNSSEFWGQEVDLGCSRIVVPAVFRK